MDNTEPQGVTETGLDDQPPPEERPESYGEMPTPATEQTQENPTSDNSATSDPKSTEETGYFGPRRKRIIAVALMLMWICLFVLPRWSDSKGFSQDYEDAYNLHLGGAILIFLGLIVVFVVVTFEHRSAFFENRIVKFTFAAIFLLGGFLYWVGGIQLAKTVNDSVSGADKKTRSYISGYAGTVFIEATFIALVVIVLDVDIVFNVLKSERVRTYYVFNTILTFVSLVAFFSYAAWRAYGTGLHSSTAECVATGWFFVLISSIYWYVIEFIDVCCKCAPALQASVKLKKNSVQLAGTIILLFGAFLVMVGMWSIATTSYKKDNAYYAGYGFFVFFYCFFLALDIYLGRIINERIKK